jgi:alkylated DNA repair dioxygenase AlkB
VLDEGGSAVGERRGAMSLVQPGLFDAAPPGLPEGLSYWPDVITPAEEAETVARLQRLPFAAFQFHGFEGRRRVVSFGWRYDFGDGALKQAEPFPAWLSVLAVRAAGLIEAAPQAFAHALITEYAPGAGIGWHRDRPVFEDVVGISFLAPARIRFRLREGAAWKRAALHAAPRSAYLLRGPARGAWEHSIAPMEALRYSITFRTFRPGGRPLDGG